MSNMEFSIKWNNILRIIKPAFWTTIVIIISWVLCLSVFGLLHVTALGPTENIWIITEPILVACIKITVSVTLFIIWILIWKQLISIVFWQAVRRSYGPDTPSIDQ